MVVKDLGWEDGKKGESSNRKGWKEAKVRKKGTKAGQTGKEYLVMR